ncbi:MAG: S9 family peptidase [Tannerellaceae bacterium]|jgi:dipeptidyl aminopeptidase/acylaminoacyl peptidase|nr:S9 family peptidase [Tannerellaceae bacterium]
MGKKSLVSLFSVMLVITAAAQPAAKKPVGSDFFTQVKRIGNLKVWDDKIFFTVTLADREKNNYSSALYQLVNNEPVRIAKGVSDYFFEDNGIIFRERGENPREAGNALYHPDHPEGNPPTTFLKLSYGYGEAAEWATLPFRPSQVEWTGKERAFYTSSYSRHTDKSKNYHVYDELPFWSNGRGDVSGQRSHLYYYNRGESTLLSDTLASVSGLRLSPDRKTLVYTLKPAWYGKQPEGNVLASLDVASLEKKEWNLFYKASYGNVTFSGNDEIVFTVNRSHEHDKIENPALYRLDIRTGKLTLIDNGALYAVGNSIGSDVGGGARAEITFDGKGVCFVTTDTDYAPLVRLAWDGTGVTRLTEGRISIQEYQPWKDGFLAIALEEQQGPEIYFIDRQGNASPLTALNKPVFDEYAIVKPVEVTFTGKTGRELNGYVLPPANYEKGRKYPAILNIHGGPKTAYGTVFFHEMQYWASEGYAVFFTNPSGSSGRGSDFSDIRGKAGEVDYNDLMDFTDAVLAQVDFVDASRLGVTGGSYGGLMTNWIVGHTNRFKAAVSQRGISSWLSFSNTSDIGYSFTYAYWGTDVWKNGQLLWDASPLKYACRVQTPVLFIHSAQDYRCWLVEGLQMYYALQYFGVPSRIVVFENENHELSRSGKPQNRIKRLEEIKGWFDKYLKNQ